ncbi:MAG: hypothetical protein K2N83_05080, partial [Eubacterium sp.]|nr:hypothetical protein [Eubacterium sp.]
ILFKYKRKLLDEMNQRYLEVSQRGISNSKVISDLIISEHPDVEAEYKEFYVSETAAMRAKRRLIFNVVGSIIYILGILVLFLGISFLTQMWGKTWLIVVDGILIWVAYLLSLGVGKITSMKRIFHIFARILLAMDVMVLTVAVFLFSLVMIGFFKSWIIVIAGVALMFVVDGIYMYRTKVKLAIINWLIYIPVVATMIYIILSALGILAWNTGWMLIIAALCLDIIVMYASMARNRQYKQEVVDAWQEN